MGPSWCGSSWADSERCGLSHRICRPVRLWIDGPLDQPRYDGAISAVAGPERLVLRSSVALSGEDLKTVGDFTVRRASRCAFVLSYGASYHSPPSAIDPLNRSSAPRRSGGDGAIGVPSVGPWTEAVKRSLITLKALTYQPTGGIWRRRDHVPSREARRRQELGLPLLLGAGRHVDVEALMNWGIQGGAAMARLALPGGRRNPRQVKIVYGVRGERRLPELELPWLRDTRFVAGAHRKRRRRADAVRRLRRDRWTRRTRRARAACRRPRMAGPEPADFGVSRKRWRPARSRDLGAARRRAHFAIPK